MIQSIFETYRCYVRPFTPGDMLITRRLLQNEEVMRYSVGGPLQMHELQEFLYKNINAQNNEGYSLWAAFTLENRFLGFVGLSEQTMAGETFLEVGYRLMPEYWRQGYASEIVQGVLYWAFNTLPHAPHLSSIIDPRNEASVKVATKNGMTLYKSAQIFHGLPCDLYRISREVYLNGV